MIYREPVIGELIYVYTSLYLGHGVDDFIGGLATINKIETHDYLPKSHCNYISVGIEERPNTLYNWRSLLEQQEKLKKEFGENVSHPEPDDRPQFNDFI